jgi:hypothetical protein
MGADAGAVVWVTQRLVGQCLDILQRLTDRRGKAPVFAAQLPRAVRVVVSRVLPHPVVPAWSFVKISASLGTVLGW